jgi:3-ketosteroid 9alpha-monooxygenase subunit A
MENRYPMPQPFGWFHIAFSDELKPGEVFPKKFFGQHLVLFRTDQGEPKLLDAYCPHLGAHLGYGGTVHGDSITCPFHSWRFNGDGICIEVPYATRPPRVVGKACIKSWALTEANRSIYAWYHPRGIDPSFEVIRIPDFHEQEEEWTEFLRKQWTVRCHIQEAHENLIDTAHFQYVHQVKPVFEFSFNQHRCQIVMDSSPQASALRSRIITECNGPGQTWARHKGFPEFIVLNPVTPLNNEDVVFNIAVTFRKRVAKNLQLVHDKVLVDMCKQVERDIPIFENKIYRSSPLYCEDDGPIQEFRHWYRQFYDS